jgi:hypothetical protein
MGRLPEPTCYVCAAAHVHSGKRRSERSADPRSWGPRFFGSKDHKSQEQESALGFGRLNLGKNRCAMLARVFDVRGQALDVRLSGGSEMSDEFARRPLRPEGR